VTWKIEFVEAARKELRKLDKTAQDRILRFLRDRLTHAEDPRMLAKTLQGTHQGYWRYRIGDRIIVKIADGKLLILVLSVGHRRDIYKRDITQRK